METQATYALSQLVKFNTIQRCRSSSTAPFHSKDNMLKLEIGALWIMKQHGASISYNRVLELSTVLGNNAIKISTLALHHHKAHSMAIASHCFNSAIHYQMELSKVFQPLRGNSILVLSNSYPCHNE
ncbi:hypothetical protein MAR_008578, partial [Mya arenaria]